MMTFSIKYKIYDIYSIFYFLLSWILHSGVSKYRVVNLKGNSHFFLVNIFGKMISVSAKTLVIAVPKAGHECIIICPVFDHTCEP